METMPARQIMTAITIAKIGRSIKNLENKRLVSLI
jgi:hypothetical protein